MRLPRFTTLFMMVLIAVGFASRAGTTAPAKSPGIVVAGPDMTRPRATQAAILLATGKVLITGGMQDNPNRWASAELYDSSTGRFTATGSMADPRGGAGHSAVLLKNGKVLVMGGYAGGGHILDSCELYDPTTGKFARTGSMHVRRGGATATVLGDGRVLVSGGEESDGVSLASAEIYDPSRGTFAESGSMATPRALHTATLLNDGRVLIAGGRSGHRAVSDRAEIFDPQTSSFLPAARMHAARYKHAAVLLRDGRVFVVGGSDDRDYRGAEADAEIYDPQRGIFSPAGKMSSPRFKIGGAVVVLSSGKVLISGGADAVEVYDPQTGSYSTAEGHLDSTRWYPTATLLPDGRVLIAGGYDGHGEATRRTWVYHP